MKANFLKILLISIIAFSIAPLAHGMEPVEDTPSKKSQPKAPKQLSVQDLIDRGELQDFLVDENELDFFEEGLTSLQGLENIPNPELIEKIYLVENHITIIPDHAFDRFINLKVLDLTNNPLIKVQPGLLDQLVNLEELRLEDTKIVEIPPRFLDALKKLKLLHLFDNKLESIPEGLLDRLTELEEFDISGNQITAFAPDLLRNQTRLKKLALEHNKLTHLPHIIDLEQLKELEIAGNPISVLPPQIIAFILKQKVSCDVPALLGEIPPYSLSQLIADLGDNWRGQLITVDPDTGYLVFDVSNRGLTDLEFRNPVYFDDIDQIKANNNFIRAIPADFFRVMVPELNGTVARFNYVREIDLSGNLIEELPVLSLQSDLPQLKLLDCANNRIQRIGGFRGKRNQLRMLYLGFNRIHTIPEDAFHSLQGLGELSLRSNNLEVLPRNIFKGLHRLHRLNLRNNALGSKELYVFPAKAKVIFYPQQIPQLKMLAAKRVAENMETQSLLQVIKTLRAIPADMHDAILVAASRNVALKIHNAHLVEELMYDFQYIHKKLAFYENSESSEDSKQELEELLKSFYHIVRKQDKDAQQALVILAPENLRALLIQEGIGENIPGEISTRQRPVEAIKFARGLEGKPLAQVALMLREKPAEIDNETLMRVASREVKQQILTIKRVEHLLAWLSSPARGQLPILDALELISRENQLILFELAPDEIKQEMLAGGFNPDEALQEGSESSSKEEESEKEFESSDDDESGDEELWPEY